MRLKMFLTALLLCVFPYSLVQAQTPSSVQTRAPSTDGNEAEVVLEEEAVETEAVDDDAVNVPVLYTMTSGTFETGGRILLSSMSNSTAASMLNQDQAEKSSLIATPDEYALAQNYPNPFNPTTTISFSLLAPSLVTLKVYNTLGQEVASVLSNELMDDGEQEVQFNANTLGSGVYFYRLVATSTETGVDKDGNSLPIEQPFTSVKKMLLIK